MMSMLFEPETIAVPGRELDENELAIGVRRYARIVKADGNALSPHKNLSTFVCP